jgi:multiple antibiotic resistance protein
MDSPNFLATPIKENRVADAVKVFFLILSALFPIVDPLTGSPIFLALTRGYLPATRKTLSRQVAFNSFYLMIASYFIGAHLLSFLGVSLPVVQVGGGLVVVATGWTLLMQKDDTHEVARDVQPQDVLRQAFYPLTLPLTVGPGSISVAITLGANTTHRYGVHVLLVIAAVIATGLIALSVFLCYGFADRLGRALGKTGMTVTIRLSSFLLVCIGVQIMWNGISGLLSAVTFHVAR